MSMHCTSPTAAAAARFHRIVARQRRTNMMLCETWWERLVEQLEAEYHESEALRLEGALTDHEATRAAMIARGATPDDRFTLVVTDGQLAYARVAL